MPQLVTIITEAKKQEETIGTIRVDNVLQAVMDEPSRFILLGTGMLGILGSSEALHLETCSIRPHLIGKLLRTHRKYRTKLVCYPAIRNENREKFRTRSRVEHLFALIS